MKSTVAYVYKWTHLPTMMWYVGSRTAEGCNPDDGYLCSSDTVKPMIIESKSDWKGYYIDPTNRMFVSSYDAATEHNVSANTIVRWTKSGKNGWKFIRKELVATENNVQQYKGEKNV